jgi:hypothetical protein
MRLISARERIKRVRFEVLTVVPMENTIWDMTPCSLVEVYNHFRGLYLLGGGGGGKKILFFLIFLRKNRV